MRPCVVVVVSVASVAVIYANLEEYDHFRYTTANNMNRDVHRAEVIGVSVHIPAIYIDGSLLYLQARYCRY